MILIILTLSLLSAPAYAADLPPGVDCSLVRQYVAEHGRAKALAWAIREGYSWGQIAKARKCLK